MSNMSVITQKVRLFMTIIHVLPIAVSILALTFDAI